jgi:hypothetical protein
MTTEPEFYTDRVHGSRPRIAEELSFETAEALQALIGRRIAGNWLADDFPEKCPDTHRNTTIGTDMRYLGQELRGAVPDATWPLWSGDFDDDVLFDVIDFVAMHISKPTEGEFHSFFGHHELSFKRRDGLAEFRTDVNRLLQRGGTVYEMSPAGKVVRIGSPEVRAALRELRPASGDNQLDDLIESARTLYTSRDEAERKASIEKLWDAFQHLKTLDEPGNTRASVARLLASVSNSAFRTIVEEEMRALTTLGNEFRIRHYEAGKPEIPVDAYDYIATRMAGLLTYLLKVSGRLAPAQEPDPRPNDSTWWTR